MSGKKGKKSKNKREEEVSQEEPTLKNPTKKNKSPEQPVASGMITRSGPPLKSL